MKKSKILTHLIVKTLKAITSLTKKDDVLLLTFKQNKLIIKGENFAFVLKTDSDFSQSIKVQVSEFVTLSKLVKKEQVDFVELSLDDAGEATNVLEQKLPNGLVLKSFFEPTEFEDCELKIGMEEVLYLDSTHTSNISKIIQKQKDLNYFSVLDFGFLFVGERQVSFLPFYAVNVDEEELSDEKSTLFSNTQLNNLVAISGEIGLCPNNSLLWGKLGEEDQLSLLQEEPDVEFEINWNEIQDSLAKFQYQNWKQLKTRCLRSYERKDPTNKTILTLTNTKELEKLITSSKAGIVDQYDLCVVEAEGLEVSFYFYQNKQLKNSFTYKLEYEVSESIQINLQVKHLLSMLNIANNQLSITYLNESEPIWSVTDLGVETITMTSLLV